MFSMMGNCFVWIKERREPPKKITLCLVGLDNAGKTTAIKGVQGESLETVAPTVGFSSIDFKVDKFQITVFDLGGGKKIRGIWKNYYAEAHAIVFVIDASDQDRLDESKQTLKELLDNPKIQGKPLLVLANKQDVEGALDEIDICEQLNLEDLVNESKCPCRVETCAANLGIGKKMDKSIKAGFKWLLLMINEEWDELGKRVEDETKEQRELEAIEKKERIERVRKIREEREKEEEEKRKREGLDKEESEDDDDDIAMGNPFKPVDKIKFTDKKENDKKKPTKQRKLPDEPKKKHRKSYSSDGEEEEVITRKVHKSPRMKKKVMQRHSSDEESEERELSTPRSSQTKKKSYHSAFLSDSDESERNKNSYEDSDEVDSYRPQKKSYVKSKKKHRIIQVTSEEDEEEERENNEQSTQNRMNTSLWKPDKDVRMKNYGEDEDVMLEQMRREVAEESVKKKKKKKKLKKKNKLGPMPDVMDEAETRPPPLPAPLPTPSWAQASRNRNMFETSSKASMKPRLAPLMERNSPRVMEPVEQEDYGARSWGLAEDLPDIPRRTKPNTDEDGEIML
ncbi:uncharacterized protein LOC100375027 [Saccoglossus kowalevskii]|uniref:ADP-ribosylation factor-like protein 13B-like n=1 Tax=Saccoglossus kowalevskii TaxID=10224 RepID=A0ABM0GQE1_SACKO|nr:PREDICTED: ADP-ribosylation factor-like protein 13B-like [Saccoglossus kowalevskii]